MADVAATILQASAELCDVARDIKETDRQARRLVKRVMGIEPAVVALKEGNARLSSDQLQQLLENVENIKSFLEGYARTTKITQALKRKANVAKFSEFSTVLAEGMQALQMDVVAVYAWAKEDSSDRQEDLEHLIDIVERMQRNRTESHAEVTAALKGLRRDERSELTAWVEIDYDKDLDFEGTIRLGSGGFGEVRTAKWNELVVAVKHLPADGLCRDDIRDLRKEIRVHSHLHHDFVVELYAASTVAPNLCMVLEYASEGSLSRYLYSTTEPLDHALQTALLYDIAQGMAFLHKKGILHCDLKSANVLVFDNLRLKLSDFGLSKVSEAAASASRAGAVGTVAWLSPEEMEENRSTELTDVYSFGIICFEVATRVEPFKGKKAAQVMRVVLFQHRRPEIPERASASPDVVPLMEQCWKQNPAGRPKGFLPVVEALASVLKRVGDPRSRTSAAEDANSPSGEQSFGDRFGTSRARLKVQERLPTRRRSPTQGGEPDEMNDAFTRQSRSFEGEGSEYSFRMQVASFAALDELTRENGQALRELKQFLGKLASDSSSNETGLGELDRLVALGKTLGEVASSHMRNKEMHRKERAFPPGSRAYYVEVRTGLTNAYLAACVIGSNFVRTSKTGGMGMAGEALKMLSGAVPVFGGLASLATAALQAGDRIIQTRRLIKILDMAPDPGECFSLAKRLALLLTDGLAAGTISTSDKAEETCFHNAAGVNGGAGVHGLSQGSDVPPCEESEKTFMEWFIEEVENCESDIGEGERSAEEQAGRKTGKLHLRMLLDAVGRDCLQGTSTSEEKIERLLQVVAPEAAVGSGAYLTTSDEALVWAPVSTDRGSGLEAEVAAMKATVQQFAAEKDELMRKVKTMEESINKPPRSRLDLVGVGGQVLVRKARPQEEHWEEGAESAVPADLHTVTQGKLREFEAVQNEKHDEHDANYSRLQGAIDRLKKNKKWSVRSIFKGVLS